MRLIRTVLIFAIAPLVAGCLAAAEATVAGTARSMGIVVANGSASYQVRDSSWTPARNPS